MTETFHDCVAFDNNILYRNNNEYICLVENNNLENFTDIWKFNRILNQHKIKDIIKTLSTKNIMDSIMYFYYDKYTDKYICFDGNHRREALIVLSKRDINIKCLCYVYEELDEDDIIKKFKIINETTPIPDIYIDLLGTKDDTYISLKEKCEIIDNVLHNYKKKYYMFYSVSSKPQRPNFNETMFYDLCNNIEDFTDELSLTQQLENINNLNKKQIKIMKVTENIMNKCVKYNFYIFVNK